MWTYPEEKMATQEPLTYVIWVPRLIWIVQECRPLPRRRGYFSVFDLLDGSAKGW